MTKKKFSQFSYNDQKYRLMNTVMMSFKTIMRQMTEKSQRKKIPK